MVLMEPKKIFNSALETKGWGLYKQGHYKESLEILKESWELRPLYYHEHYLHIQDVEKAIANQNK